MENKIKEIEDEWDTVDEERVKRDHEYFKWLKNREPDPIGVWDTNPDNAYKCFSCPHRNEGNWNTERPCGCLKCWVTQTCHTWDGRDDI